MSLARRLLVVMLAIIAITALSIGIIVDHSLRRGLAPLGFERQVHVLESAAQMLTSDASAARADVLAARRSAPVAEVLSAAPGTRASNAHESVLLVFRTLMAARPEYLQLRLLAADGREVVRIERPSAAEALREVPDEQLQNKRTAPTSVRR